MKYYINIQSISDIITNSSSEVFCRICSKEHIEEIYEILESVILGESSEYEPVVSLNTLNEDNIEYIPKEFLNKVNLNEKYIELKLPYNIWYPNFF